MGNYLTYNDKLLTKDGEYLTYESTPQSAETFHVGFHSGWTTTVTDIMFDPCNNDNIFICGSFTSWDGWNETNSLSMYHTKILNNGQKDLTYDQTRFNTTVERLFYDASNSKIYAVGSFTQFDGVNAYRFARFNIDASYSADNTFNASIGNIGFNNNTTCCIVDPEGKIYVGGQFSTFAGVASVRFARLNNDGTRDSTYDMSTGFDNYPTCMEYDSSNRLYVGGVFTKFNNVPAYRLIRFNADGTRDLTFDTSILGGFDSNVWALKYDQKNDKMYVGGDFAKYRGNSTYNAKITRLNMDGTQDASFACVGFNQTTRDITIDSSGRILAAGMFHACGGAANSRGIYRLLNDGTVDTTFDTNFGTIDGQSSQAACYTVLTDSQNRVYLGGGFRSYPTGGYGKYLLPGLVRILENGVNDTINDRNWS